MGFLVWSLIMAMFLGYQGFCLVDANDRWPPITEILAVAIRNPVARAVLFGLWLWLGWHLFVRTARFLPS
jgi:hypothetical protein